MKSNSALRTEERIAARFIAEVGTQELWATIHNCAPLVQASGWTAEKYYGKWHEDALPFPAFIDIKDGVGVLYIPLTKARKLAEEIFTKYLNDPASLQGIIQKRDAYERAIRSAYTACTDTYFDSASDMERKEVLSVLRDDTWFYNALVFFSTGFDKEVVVAVFTQQSLQFSDAVWERATKPPTPSFELRHGWQIAEMQNAGEDSLLGEACQYFFASYDVVPTVTESKRKVLQDYAKYIGPDGLAPSRREQEELRRKQAEHDSWVESLHGENAALARFSEIVVRLRDERKDYLLMLVTVAFRAARALLRRAGMDEALAQYVMYDELFLSSEEFVALRKDIEKRRNGFSVYCAYAGDVHTQYGNSEMNRNAIELFRESQHAALMREADIRGVVGSRGTARGKVKIVLNLAADAKLFEDGMVLVAGMTRPEYVPLMKKAVAIITDEGGITCHAAIVSRELGIPCIIGTKMATKMLKDGDLVEVDATRGVVTILQKASEESHSISQDGTGTE